MAPPLAPHDRTDWRRQGAAAERNGELAVALAAYERALELSPDEPELLNDLGRLALRMALPEVAEAFFRRCLSADPQALVAQDGLARALKDQHRYDEAVTVLRPALMAHPGEPILWNTLGSALAQQGECATALTFLDEALRLDPAFAQALYNRSGVRMDLGDMPGALEDCDAAIALLEARGDAAPGDAAMMRFARATLLLGTGDLRRGWPAYEARFDPAYVGRARFEVDAPRFAAGAPLHGRSLLVVAEQGVGDEAMFAGLVPDILQALGPQGRLSLAVEPRLVPLFRRTCPTVVVGAHATRRDITGATRTVPDLAQYGVIDAWAPLGDFLARFRSSAASFPCDGVTLRPDPARVAYWRETLQSALPGLRVGFTWRSGLLTGERRRQYAPLQSWGALLRSPGVSFVNLQYGDCGPELDEIEHAFGVEVWRPPGLDIRNDLDDLGALASALDLVIGCSNASSNIAAACGAPTWMLSSPSTWTRLGADRLPWYPRARAFSAPGFNDWAPAMAEMAGALQGWIATSPVVRPLL